MKLIATIKNDVMKSSRNKKLEHFYSLCDITSNVLDVGVTDNEHNSQVNLFLNEFRFSSNQYTGLAVEPMNNIRKKHPKKRFVEYSGDEIPFNDNAFDWVFSNAVIEHVGSEEKQVKFINEMNRVGKNTFFTTPNKYFPVESHTNTLFRHWYPPLFYRWCEKNSPYWNKNNLVLLGHKNLKELLEKSDAKKYVIKRNLILFYPMTYTVICTR